MTYRVRFQLGNNPRFYNYIPRDHVTDLADALYLARLAIAFGALWAVVEAA